MSHKIINAFGFRLGYTTLWIIRQMPLHYKNDNFKLHFYINCINLMFLNLSDFFILFAKLLHKVIIMERRKKFFFLNLIYNFCYKKKSSFKFLFAFFFFKKKFF